MTNFNSKCPKCKNKEFWQTADKRLKCKQCRFIFTPKPNPFNISNDILRALISEFLLEHSTNVILQRVQISKYKLLKILTLLRTLMANDIPEIFQEEIKPGLGPILKPTNAHPIGILTKEGKIYAKILPNLEPEEIKSFLKNENPQITERKEWLNSFALIFKGNFYRVVVPPKGKRHRLDSLESFWGYLKRKLSARGGIRKEKLPLYLGEYVWRYNNRKLILKEQEEKLLKLLIASVRLLRYNI